MVYFSSPGRFLWTVWYHFTVTAAQYWRSSATVLERWRASRMSNWLAACVEKLNWDGSHHLVKPSRKRAPSECLHSSHIHNGLLFSCLSLFIVTRYLSSFHTLTRTAFPEEAFWCNVINVVVRWRRALVCVFALYRPSFRFIYVLFVPFSSIIRNFFIVLASIFAVFRINLNVQNFYRRVFVRGSTSELLVIGADIFRQVFVADGRTSLSAHYSKHRKGSFNICTRYRKGKKPEREARERRSLKSLQSPEPQRFHNVGDCILW